MHLFNTAGFVFASSSCDQKVKIRRMQFSHWRSHLDVVLVQLNGDCQVVEAISPRNALGKQHCVHKEKRAGMDRRENL